MLVSEILNEIQFFDKKAYQYVTGQNAMSRECIIFIPPASFLKLASPGRDSDKERNVEQIMRSGERLHSMPFLGVSTDEDGDIEVRSNGQDHEGRHRARALLKRGVNLIPVRIISKEDGVGPAYRWGSNPKRPKFLSGYNGYMIHFPKTFPYKKGS